MNIPGLICNMCIDTRIFLYKLICKKSMHTYDVAYLHYSSKFWRVVLGQGIFIIAWVRSLGVTLHSTKTHTLHTVELNYFLPRSSPCRSLCSK